MTYHKSLLASLLLAPLGLLVSGAAFAEALPAPAVEKVLKLADNEPNEQGTAESTEGAQDEGNVESTEGAQDEGNVESNEGAQDEGNVESNEGAQDEGNVESNEGGESEAEDGAKLKN